MESQEFVGVGGGAPQDGSVDLRRIVGALAASKWWIIIPTLLALGAGLAFVTFASPRYSAAARVTLEYQESYFTRPDKGSAEFTTANIYDPEGVQSEAETVATDDLARKAVAKLGLVKLAEFNPEGAGLLSMLSSLLGGHPYADAEDRAVENFLLHLNVTALAKTRVLQFEFSSKDPQLAAEGANTAAALYLTAKADARRAITRADAAWLSNQISALRGKVAQADAAVEAYRNESGLLTGANSMMLPTQQLAEITTQMAAARATQAAATSKAQLLRQMLREGRLEAVPDVAKDDSLRRYAELRVNLRSQFAEESRTMLPGHPKIQELSGRIAGLENEMRSAAAKVVAGLEDEARLAAQQVSSLEAAIAKQSRAVANSNVDEVKLHALELDAKSAREQLESYAQKYREAISHDADNALPPNARVTSKAVTPRTPVFPKKVPILLLSALAGLFLSTGVVISRTLLVDPAGSVAVAPVHSARRAPSPADVEAEPALSGRAPLSSGPLDSFLDSLVGLSAPGACAPLLVAADGAEGALSIALTSARRLSRTGRTILLDLGESQPWLTDVFDRELDEGHAHLGVSDFLRGRASFAMCKHRDLSSALEIVPAGSSPIDAGGVEALLEDAMDHYQFIVIHASDWRSPAAMAALPSVAAVALCAPAFQLAEAQERLRRALPDPSVVIKGVATAMSREAREKAA